MELRQLEYFQAVSRLKSLTRTAEQLYVTQPTISLAIQRLEEELGVTLFDRRQKNFKLTVEGQIFLQRIDATLSGLQQAVTEMQDYKNLRKGTITLGLPPMLGTYFLPTIFADYQTQCPAVEIQIVEAGSLRIRQLLLNDEIDVGIVVISDLEPQLETHLIAKGEIQVCLSPDHPLSQLSVISFSQLRNEAFVLLPEGTYVRRVISHEFQRNKINPRIILSSGQVETLLRLVKKGIGLSFLIDFVASQYPDIVVRPLAQALPLEIGVAWKKNKYLSPASMSFVEFMDQSSPFAFPTTK